MTTIEYIRYRIDHEHQNEFLAAYAAAVEPLAASPHCLAFELSQGVEEPDRFVLRISWDSVEGHLQGFRQSDDFRDFFAHIRPYVEAIDEMAHYTPTPLVGDGAGTPSPPSLYDWAGGREAIEALFVHFYDTVLADNLLRPLFKDMDPNHPQHVAAWIGEVFGGPADYTANHGGHPEMLRHHLNREITEAQRRRWIDLLVDASDHVGLPDDPEFRATFMGYVEWGTRLAKIFSQPGATPNLDEPVPSWKWTLPPWQD